MNMRLPRTCTRRLRLLRVATPSILLLTALQVYTATISRPVPKRTEGGRTYQGHWKRHVLLWTQTRSGSRLTMKLLTAAPSSFTMEEPLRNRGTNDHNSVKFLQDIFQCKFLQHLEYLKHLVYIAQQESNEISTMCSDELSLCNNRGLMIAMCQAAHISLAKVAAEELGIVTPSPEDSGSECEGCTFSKRSPSTSGFEAKITKDFGPFILASDIYHEEKNLTRICNRYQQDLSAARSLLNSFPHRYTLVRYEDLALHPQREVRRLYHFLNLPYTAQVANTVAIHTLGIKRGEFWSRHPFSTYKNSSATVFAWRDQLDFNEVTRLQQECGAVMKAYGYRTFLTPHHFHDPHNTPLLPLPPLL